ncbi:uncharacterized protein F4822DRAFT_120968 [Hypoxylon trugodes]|uniref:uncharacterized protein n=1 Tax=Hypoxylon trugodes TaxID=326681 RepID=UPI00218CC699|nr:uncharacterized protein F4822DRAFT_120968 [Hypoxylon trugodes]KAI1392242.1 hypothetical protein F4822DRAFT_120968 [Hypoxylon trugodes]
MHLPPSDRFDHDLYAPMNLSIPSQFSITSVRRNEINQNSSVVLADSSDHGSLPGGYVPSLDSRRLRVQHRTEGYRDGITIGKAQSIQAGFDEGFDIGANIGQAAGRILGLLEGVVAALKDNRHCPLERTIGLLSDAAGDLSANSLFSAQYWTSDGVWTFPVKGSSDDGDASSQDVANQHPLIMKWNDLVNCEVMRWGLNIDRLRISLDGSATQPEVEELPIQIQVMSQNLTDW